MGFRKILPECPTQLWSDVYTDSYHGNFRLSLFELLTIVQHSVPAHVGFSPIHKASLSPQSFSSELSMQSFTPSQCSSLGIQMRFWHVQSESRQPTKDGQFSSSEPVGHCFCPSQRADALTQPTESTQWNWPGGQPEKPEGTENKMLREEKKLPLASVIPLKAVFVKYDFKRWTQTTTASGRI